MDIYAFLELHGIPYEQLEVDDESDYEHWVATFVIPDGTEVTADDVSYYTKAMTVEKLMAELDASECNDLQVGNIGPVVREFVDPEMDAAPEVDAAPAVVKGEVQ